MSIFPLNTLFLFVIVLCFVMIFGIKVKGYNFFIIVSGSMHPALQSGSLIVTQSRLLYFTDEIVVFNKPTSKTTQINTDFNSAKSNHLFVTHRVVAINNANGQRSYITQGDANPVFDEIEVMPQEIVGRVIVVIPKIGIVVGWIYDRLLYMARFGKFFLKNFLKF